MSCIKKTKSCLDDIDKIVKKKMYYLYHVVFGAVSWLLIMGAWIYYWVYIDNCRPMNLLELILCFISIGIPILVISITYKKYMVLGGYEILFKMIQTYLKKQDNIEDNKSNI